jgi:uncharacterized protein YjbI with pentapeptide repeats
MGTEDTLSSPPGASQDEKEAQKVPDHPRKNGTLKATHKWTGFSGKTLWDWLQLLGVLAIPLVVAGATLVFSIQQANLAQQQHATDQKIANQQREADQQRALDQQEAMILQTYLDNIQDLLLNHHLANSKSGDNVATLARARTLTALRGLDQLRKGRLIQFLYEAKLIGFLDNNTGKIFTRIIDLYGIDLSFADLSFTNLYGIDLSFADLHGANLRSANLHQASFYLADLSVADLSFAYLHGADLTAADLSGTNLSGADLSFAYLHGARHLTQQQLDQVSSCMGARLPQGLKCNHTPPPSP